MAFNWLPSLTASNITSPAHITGIWVPLVLVCASLEMTGSDRPGYL